MMAYRLHSILETDAKFEENYREDLLLVHNTVVSYSHHEKSNQGRTDIA